MYVDAYVYMSQYTRGVNFHRCLYPEELQNIIKIFILIIKKYL